MLNIKKNKAALVSISVFCGIMIGFGVSINWNFSEHAVAADPSVPTLDKLNQDFIRISEGVTPAVVSISMTRKVKTQDHQRVPMDEDFFNYFFNSPFQTPDMEPEERQQKGLGSGVIVDAAKGYILTNNHVVADASEIKVTLTDRRTFTADVVGTDPRTDLAVIHLQNPKNLSQAELGNSGKLHVGEWVLAIGNPFGLSSTVTAGIISAQGRANVGVADFEDFIQTDAAINPGNSGGALINIRGEVIGINTAIATRTSGYMGIGFAIPSNMAKKVMQDLITKGKVTRSQLGVFIRQMDEVLAKSLNVPPTKGIVVTGVMDSSPAARAGLQKYDVILELNGEPVNDINQFRNGVAATSPDTTIEIKLQRGDKILTLKPTLQELKDDSGNQKPTLEKEGRNEKMGFDVQNLTSDIAKQLGLSNSTQGVIVNQVSKNSNAYNRGLRRGDVITEINRKSVASTNEFYKQMEPLKSGDVVLLGVIRKKASILIAFEVE